METRVGRSAARRRHRMVCVAGLAALCGTAGVAFASVVEIADCDQLVGAPDANRYRLVADVDCSAHEDAALTVPNGSGVRLDGHTLRAADVLCVGKCRIDGPGTLDGGGVLTRDRAIVRRVDVVGSPGDGVEAGRATIIDSLVAESAENGIEVDRHAKLVRTTVTRNRANGVAVSKRAGNDCGRGRIIAFASTVMANGADGDCGTDEICADVAACDVRGTKLHATVCDHSRQLGSGFPGSSCGVCSLD